MSAGEDVVFVVSNPDPRRDSGELRVMVRILETRSAYGREDCLITPVSGSGEMWVSRSRLEAV